MNTTPRCGGSRLTTYTDSGGARTTVCPGCEDCRPKVTQTPPGGTATAADLEARREPPLSPAEALAAAIAEYGPPMAEYYDAVEALRALDAECDRLRAALGHCNTRASMYCPSHAEAMRELGMIAGVTFTALATDARQVTRG